MMTGGGEKRRGGEEWQLDYFAVKVKWFLEGFEQGLHASRHCKSRKSTPQTGISILDI